MHGQTFIDENICFEITYTGAQGRWGYRFIKNSQVLIIVETRS